MRTWLACCRSEEDALPGGGGENAAVVFAVTDVVVCPFLFDALRRVRVGKEEETAAISFGRVTSLSTDIDDRCTVYRYLLILTYLL